MAPRKRGKVVVQLTSGKRGRKPPPPGETARDRFLRLGQKRVTDALRQIRLIGNLSTPEYKSTPEEIAAIQVTLHEAVDEAIGRFAKAPKPIAVEELFDLKALSKRAHV